MNGSIGAKAPCPLQMYLGRGGYGLRPGHRYVGDDDLRIAQETWTASVPVKEYRNPVNFPNLGRIAKLWSTPAKGPCRQPGAIKCGGVDDAIPFPAGNRDSRKRPRQKT